MPRKKKVKEAPATEPTPAADNSPAMEAIRASQAAKAKIEPERPMPEPDSHVERLYRPKPGMQPVPKGFLNIDSYPVAGIRVNRSQDRSVLAIQFAEDRRASRIGLNSEIDTLEIEGFRYQPMTRQWEREDHERPGTNAVGAKRLGVHLANARTGRGVE